MANKSEYYEVVGPTGWTIFSSEWISDELESEWGWVVPTLKGLGKLLSSIRSAERIDDRVIIHTVGGETYLVRARPEAPFVGAPRRVPRYPVEDDEDVNSFLPDGEDEYKEVL